MSVKLLNKEAVPNKDGFVKNNYGHKENKGDVKRFISYVGIASVILVSIRFNSNIATIWAVLLCVWSLFGPLNAIQSLTLFAFIRFHNPAIVMLGSAIGPLTWLLLLLVAIRYVPWGFANIRKRLIPVIVFAITVTALSIVTSKALDISILKIISFLIGALSVISICNRLTTAEIKSAKIWLFSLILVIVILSIGVMFNRNIGYFLNGVGFQGILNHPQTLGTFLAPPAAFFAGRFAYSKSEIVTIDLIISLILVSLILMSQARTAAVAVSLSFILTMLFIGIAPIKAKIKSKSSFIVKFFGGGLILLMMLMFFKPAQEAVMGFIYKRGAGNVEEAFSSRSSGYESQIGNFIASPLIGHGFGIYPGPYPYLSVTYYMGIPISAAVEKGFLPISILEEVGLIGASAFIYLLFSITAPVLKGSDPGWICLHFACLFVNIGEAVFFAIGGMGIFYWILMSVSAVVHKAEKSNI